MAKTKADGMLARIRQTVTRIPRGKVVTYGEVARATGYPGAARQVVWALHGSRGLPWQRVVGAKGRILLRGEHALEQRLRLQSEGVAFIGDRVDMKAHGFAFPGVRKKAR
jgi:methylated-DNA-protein-cysteine methyltransferase related protein